jgi:hypothetical protein
MERCGSISNVSFFVLPAVRLNGRVVFNSPDGTVKITCVPLIIMPVAEHTTIRIWVYFPAGMAEEVKSSETLVKYAKSIEPPFLVDTVFHPLSLPSDA